MWIDDQILTRFREPLVIDSFVPETTLVVLGSSNDPEREVDLASCKVRGIAVTRRYGGGGTVVLYPGCVVLRIGTWVKENYNNGLYFKYLNQSVIDCLASRWPAMNELSQSGISDIVRGDKKIAGTSLFRSRHYLLYQASILVDLDPKLIQDCLRHPSKEPEYRRGRGHESFLTSLASFELEDVTPSSVALLLGESLRGEMQRSLAEHLSEPQISEVKSLEERLARAAGCSEQ